MYVFLQKLIFPIILRIRLFLVVGLSDADVRTLFAGVLGFSEDGGFFLTHSAPKFPFSPSSFPEYKGGLSFKKLTPIIFKHTREAERGRR
jgi:hypothetical protein